MCGVLKTSSFIKYKKKIYLTDRMRRSEKVNVYTVRSTID